MFVLSPPFLDIAAWMIRRWANGVIRFNGEDGLN